MIRWTPERVEHLTRLWNEGLSLAQIARDLGIKSHNQIRHQAEKIGLPTRTKPSQMEKAA